jgi:transcription elongation factor GreA
MARKTRDVHLVTKDGLKKLKEELEYRSTVKKEELKNTLNEMIQAGDLSENDGYTLALDDFRSNDFEIERLRSLIKRAKVVENKTDGVVELGDTVVLQDNNGKEVTYTIVGEDEADILRKKISYKSPLGASMVGKKKGASFKFTTPRGKVEYKILDVKD